ncbi:hypothetical protein E0H75_31390 [Kribbella capetownensis]|uniref:Uncharacterized protein n=1 Tax=Kribbella capetownensis TaxID=1572659 RepID=A0A4R0JJN7_9ACTN|nr:hypothetical protein [Kribbella capetownensis]TCC45026.1 hypothetical protein E0H75_31390 [Kribbella capetownensis]
MKGKWAGVLALLGAVWMLFLFFNSADVKYDDGFDGDPVSVKCPALGRLSSETQDLDEPLSDDESAVLSAYMEKVRASDDPPETQQERAVDARQTILADCQQARTDRVALLILVAFATGLLIFAQVLRSRRKPVDE